MPTNNDPLYIGATNWANLQQQYTPYQLSQATTRQWNTNTGQYDIYWNPAVNISSIPREMQVPTNTGNINTNNLTNQTISGGTSFDNNTIANMFGSGQTSAYNAAMMLQQNRENALQQQMQSQQQQYDQANMNLDQWLGRDVYQELLAERNRQGYDEKLQLLNNYNSQLRDLTLDYQMGRQTIRRESRLESMTKGRNANIYEQYANEATLINNNIAGVQGQLDRIEKNTDKFFEFYSQQRQDMIDNYTSLRNMANQNIIDLSKEEREDIDRRIDIMNTEVQRQDEQRNAKMEILMQAYQNGVDPTKYGVSLTDDFETLMNKLGPAVAQQYQNELAKKYAGSGSGSGGSKYAGADQITSDAEAASQKLVALRNAGKLSDANYRAEIYRIMERNNMFDEDYGMVSSMVNNLMGGGTSTQQETQTIKTPTQQNKYKTSSASAGQSFGKYISRGQLLPEITSAILSLGGAFSNFINGLIGWEELSAEQQKKIRKMAGGSF
jgi:hypothetical protein